MDRNYEVITYSKLPFILRGTRVAIFADIKIVTMFFKTIMKDPRKVKRIRSYYQNPIYIYFWM